MQQNPHIRQRPSASGDPRHLHSGVLLLRAVHAMLILIGSQTVGQCNGQARTRSETWQVFLLDAVLS